MTPLFAELERIKKDNEIMRDALKESKIDLEVAELLQQDVDKLSQLLSDTQKSFASEKEENNRLVIASRRQAAQIAEKDVRIRELEGLLEKQEKKVLHPIGRFTTGGFISSSDQAPSDEAEGIKSENQASRQVCSRSRCVVTD